MTEQRLAAIERAQGVTNVLLAALGEKMEDRLDSTDERLSRVGKIVWGENGSVAAPGLIVRLDRVEQVHERSRWLTRAVIGAVLGLIAVAVFA